MILEQVEMLTKADFHSMWKGEFSVAEKTPILDGNLQWEGFQKPQVGNKIKAKKGKVVGTGLKNSLVR